MELTFAFDCELNDLQDFVKEGTIVQVAENVKQYDGYAAVIITEGYTYNEVPVKFEPFVDYFTLKSFVEYR